MARKKFTRISRGIAKSRREETPVASSDRCEVSIPFSEFRYTRRKSGSPSRKILEFLNSVNYIGNSENGTLTLQRLFIHRSVVCADNIPSRIPSCNESERARSPSRLVNFPGKFITRRLVLSGIAWLRGITIESTESAAQQPAFFSLSFSFSLSRKLATL